MDDFNATDRPERISDEAIRASQKTDSVMQSLLSIEDPDWAKFQADDPEWFLRAAGRAVRKYCGWHLFPNIRQHLINIETGAQGIIMLPSRHVTEVDELTLSYGEQDDKCRGVHRDAYIWYQDGWIQMKGTAFRMDWYAAGYYYGNDPYYLPITQPGLATVTLWHGYHALPDDIKEVAFELAQTAMIMKAGNVKMLATPGEYRIELAHDAGLTLNPDQMRRLSSYRIGMVG